MSTATFVLVIASAAFHALWNFASKKAAGDLCVLYWGLWLACLVYSPFVIFSGRDWGSAAAGWKVIAATGAIHAVYFFLLSRAYEKGDISVVYPLARGSGVAGTAAAAWLLLDESLAPATVAGIAAVVAGSFILGAAGRKRSSRGMDVAYALATGASVAAYSVTDRVAAGIVDPVLYMFAMFLISAVLLTPYAVFLGTARMRRALTAGLRYAAVIGPGSMTTYLMIVIAMKSSGAGIVAATREAAVAFGALLGVFLLGEPFGWRKAAGIAAITAGLIAIRAS